MCPQSFVPLSIPWKASPEALDAVLSPQPPKVKRSLMFIEPRRGQTSLRVSGSPCARREGGWGGVSGGVERVGMHRSSDRGLSSEAAVGKKKKILLPSPFWTGCYFSPVKHS